MTSNQRPFLQLFGALSLLWLLLNLPLLLGIRVLPWDAMISSYPTVYFNVHSLRAGLAPWWNPYIYAGYPQIADPQGMLFSPLLMLWMLLRVSPGATWFAWGVLLHVLMGATAMLALLRRSGANAFGSLIGAAVFMAGGAASARLEHTALLLAYAYAPVVLLALRYFLAAPGWQRGLLVGLAAGAMTTQLVQATYLFALMLVGYTASASVAHWPSYSPADRWRWGLGATLALVCALAIGLPQLLFTWAFTTLSNRAMLPLTAAAAKSIDLRMLLTLLDPNALHALRGKYIGPADRVEAYLYIGALPSLLLVGLGMAWREPRQRRQLMFFAAVAFVACAYMLGVNTPFYGWLYGWLPGMQQFRRPSDAAYLLNFSFAMATGLAASHFPLDSRRRVTMLLAVAAVWLGLSSLQMRHTDMRWQWESLAAAVLTAAALWRLRRPGTTMRTAVWVLFLLLADYRCFSLDGTFNEGRDDARNFLHDASTSFVAEKLKAPAGILPARIEPVDAGAAWDNFVAMRGIASTQGYNPLRYALYDQWYGARDNGASFGGAPSRVNTLFNPAPDSQLTDLLGVRYLIKGMPVDRAPWSPPSGYTKIFTGGGSLEVWQNMRAYPRLLTPTRALLPASGQAPSPEAFAATDFRDAVWLTPRDRNDRLADQNSAAKCGARLQILDARSTPTQLALRTRSAASGWLVLSELDFPGWKADVDGADLPIHRANGMFRAVCVPAGEHTVRFVFHPWAMVADAWRQYSNRRRAGDVQSRPD